MTYCMLNLLYWLTRAAEDSVQPCRSLCDAGSCWQVNWTV